MKSYTLTEFAEKIQEEIKNYLPPEIRDEICIQHGDRNSALPEIYVQASEKPVVPLLYLESYYDRYCHGEKMDDLLDELAAYIDRHRESLSADVNPYLRRRRCKNLIVGRYVNIRDRENDPDLSNRPVTTFEDSDVGIVYDVCLPRDLAGGGNSVPIDFQIMDSWGMTVDMLYRLSHRNLPRLRPASIQTMAHVLSSAGIDSAKITDGDASLCVISNSSYCQGAIAISYPGVDAQIKEILGGDYYLLPASVHEMIAVPQTEDPSELAPIIAAVNREMVDPDDRLGGVPYIFRDGHIYPVNIDAPSESKSEDHE